MWSQVSTATCIIMHDEGPIGVIETKWYWGCIIAPGLQREVIDGHLGRFEEKVQG